MTKYIKAELYRLAHKRSTYIFYGSLSVAVVAILTIFGQINSGQTVLELGYALIPIVAIVVTTQVFISVYCDDFASKIFGNTISTGLSRFEIILSKLVLFILHTLTIVLCLVAIYAVLYVGYGGRFNATDMELIRWLGIYALSMFTATIAFALLSSILAYQFQSTSISVAFYIILNMGLVNNIIGLLRNVIPYMDVISDHTITNLLVDSLNYQTGSTPQLYPLFFGVCALYVGASLLISSFLFSKKEISV